MRAPLGPQAGVAGSVACWAEGMFPFHAGAEAADPGWPRRRAGGQERSLGYGALLRGPGRWRGLKDVAAQSIGCRSVELRLS